MNRDNYELKNTNYEFLNNLTFNAFWIASPSLRATIIKIKHKEMTRKIINRKVRKNSVPCETFASFAVKKHL
jgi:hypothetical protein